MSDADTTTEAGWDACVKAYYNGEELEFYVTNTNQWRLTSTHPSNWRHDIDFRIKPAPVPKVGDVWKSNSTGKRAIVMCVGTEQVKYRWKFCGSDFYWSIPTFLKNCTFIGKIDLGLLEGKT